MTSIKGKILGITDDRSTCDHCGKTGLERVVAIELADGAIVYYGTTCATRVNATWKSGIKSAVSLFERQQKAAAKIDEWMAKGFDPQAIVNRVNVLYLQNEYRDGKFIGYGNVVLWPKEAK